MYIEVDDEKVPSGVKLAVFADTMNPLTTQPKRKSTWNIQLE